MEPTAHLTASARTYAILVGPWLGIAALFWFVGEPRGAILLSCVAAVVAAWVRGHRVGISDTEVSWRDGFWSWHSVPIRDVASADIRWETKRTLNKTSPHQVLAIDLTGGRQVRLPARVFEEQALRDLCRRILRQ